MVAEATIDLIIEGDVVFVELQAVLDVARLSAERFTLEGNLLAASTMSTFVDALSLEFQRLIE